MQKCSRKFNFLFGLERSSSLYAVHNSMWVVVSVVFQIFRFFFFILLVFTQSTMLLLLTNFWQPSKKKNQSSSIWPTVPSNFIWHRCTNLTVISLRQKCWRAVWSTPYRHQQRWITDAGKCVSIDDQKYLSRRGGNFGMDAGEKGRQTCWHLLWWKISFPGKPHPSTLCRLAKSLRVYAAEKALWDKMYPCLPTVSRSICTASSGDCICKDGDAVWQASKCALFIGALFNIPWNTLKQPPQTERVS